MHNANAWRLFFLALFLFGCAIWLPILWRANDLWIFPAVPNTVVDADHYPHANHHVDANPHRPADRYLDSRRLQHTHSDFHAVFAACNRSLFQGVVTPNPDAVFTPLQFSTQFDGVNPIDPKTVFELPIQTMYGGFDYNNLIPGVQWTALWYHDRKLICYETQPWDGGTGGIGGYTECANPIGGWLPGEYEVQIFMGYDWKVVGRFISD